MLTKKQKQQFDAAAQPLMQFLQTLKNKDCVAVVNILEADLLELKTRSFEHKNDSTAELSKLWR